MFNSKKNKQEERELTDEFDFLFALLLTNASKTKGAMRISGV
jgi:hypothetical protein